MRNQNTALLMKFLDKFYNHADIPWVKLTWLKLYSNDNTPPHVRNPSGSFWWKDIIKLFGTFKAFAVCHVNSGASISLWNDNWSGQPLEFSSPHLFSFTRKPKCSLKFYIDNDPNRVFFLPLSSQASDQLNAL